MKNFYLLLISFIIAFNSYSQCQFTFQLMPQSSCDTVCNNYFTISANSAPGPHYLFIDSIYQNVFTTGGTFGPFCPGTYNLLITDSAGCTYADSITLVVVPGFNLQVTGQNPSCSFCSDGMATVNVTGGSPPYSYLWSNSSNTQNQTMLTQGFYCVTVTDITGCTVTDCINLSVAPCGFFTQTNTQPFCDTTCNSMVSFISNSGVGPHHLFLNNVYFTSFTTAGTVSGLCHGVFYDVFITDSIGCNYTDSIYIPQQMPMMGAISSIPPSCTGCSDGVAVVTVTGGVSPYNYAWSSGHTGAAIQGLSAGIYCVYISDTQGCYITLCDTIGSLNGNSFISGIIYLDLDTSGTQNTPEPGLSNIQVMANPGGYIGFSSITGAYFIDVPNGTYNVSVIPPGNWQQTSTPLTYNLTVNNSVYWNNDFGLLPDTATPSAQLNITSGIPRCNWSSWYYLNYKNTGLMLAEGEVIFNLDPLVNVLNMVPPPSSVSGNNYTWNFNNLYPYVNQSIFIYVTMPGAGNILNSSAIINLHDNSSNVIFSDTTYKTQTVTCAWDPNDKLVIPEGVGSQNAVALNTSELDFTIRFQNTGNDTAFVVIIKDTLDANLDLSTFEIIAASHEMYAQMDPGGILTFTFDNILLPDSNINEPASHGFVRYRIQPLQPVTDPTVITNTAYIIFDQNPAVVTNTTLTTFSDNLLSVAEINGGGIIKAYPNPFSNEVLIQFEKSISANLKLYDFSGRVVRSNEIKNSSSFVLKKEDLKSGIYLLMINTEEGLATIKLMIY